MKLHKYVCIMFHCLNVFNKEIYLRGEKYRATYDCFLCPFVNILKLVSYEPRLRGFYLLRVYMQSGLCNFCLFSRTLNFRYWIGRDVYHLWGTLRIVLWLESCHYPENLPKKWHWLPAISRTLQWLPLSLIFCLLLSIQRNFFSFYKTKFIFIFYTKYVYFVCIK